MNIYIDPKIYYCKMKRIFKEFCPFCLGRKDNFLCFSNNGYCINEKTEHIEKGVFYYKDQIHGEFPKYKSLVKKIIKDPNSAILNMNHESDFIKILCQAKLTNKLKKINSYTYRLKFKDNL